MSRGNLIDGAFSIGIGVFIGYVIGSVLVVALLIYGIIYVVTMLATFILVFILQNWVTLAGIIIILGIILIVPKFFTSKN